MVPATTDMVKPVAEAKEHQQQWADSIYHGVTEGAMVYLYLVQAAYANQDA